MSPCGRPIRSHRPCQRISLPIAHAASSMTIRSWRRATSRIAGEVARHAELMDAEEGARPGRDRLLELRGSMLKVSASMSTNTGRAPPHVPDAVGRGDEASG